MTKKLKMVYKGYYSFDYSKYKHIPTYCQRENNDKRYINQCDSCMCLCFVAFCVRQLSITCCIGWDQIE